MKAPDDTEDRLFVTGDGSHSIYSKEFAVAYHSVHGAVQESQHVFIAAGLQPVLEASPGAINLLEVGFGTGLNALLVQQLSMRHPQTLFRYHAVERFPLPLAEVTQLNYPEVLRLPAALLQDLHAAKWGAPTSLTDNFSLDKRRVNFLEGLSIWPSGSMHVVFYDAFAPSSQPEMWTPQALKICYDMLAPGGRLVTYCAKGQFKRDLRSVGFTVTGLPGPPGKREMTLGVKE